MAYMYAIYDICKYINIYCTYYINKLYIFMEIKAIQLLAIVASKGQ